VQVDRLVARVGRGQGGERRLAVRTEEMIAVAGQEGLRLLPGRGLDPVHDRTGERVTSASLARLAQHLLGECGQAESRPRRLVDTSGGGQERGPIRIAWCDTRGSDRHEIVNETESGEGEAEPAALIVRQLIPHRGVGAEQASQRRRQEVVGLSRSEQATGVAQGWSSRLGRTDSRTDKGRR